MTQFKNKIVYITGGSSGIGLHAARLFASYGADVVLVARNLEKLESAKIIVDAAKQENRQSVSVLSCDVSNYSDVCKKMETAVSEYGIPDILINSAGINKYADHFEQAGVRWHHTKRC